MSQKKVDAYKEQKANRKETLKKEKRMLLVEKIIGLAVCVVIVGWVGYSVVDKITDNSGKEVVQVDTVLDTSALDAYISSLTAEAEEDTDEEEADTDAEETEADDTEAETEVADTEESSEEEAQTADSDADADAETEADAEE